MTRTVRFINLFQSSPTIYAVVTGLLFALAFGIGYWETKTPLQESSEVRLEQPTSSAPIFTS